MAALERGSPSVSTGMSQSLPLSTPIGSGCVLTRISTAATMSLSATGSRKAPNSECRFCRGKHTVRVFPRQCCSMMIHARALGGDPMQK